ncbi:hypothetical protein ACF0H5_020024 [Mactra antiquata]
MANKTKNGELLYANTNDFPAIIVVTCMLSVFSIVGTTGNAFVLYVFSKKKDKTTSTVFILALALIDFVTCLFLIPFTIVVEYMYKKVDSDIVCKVYQFFITSNVPFSAFIMTAIAFDRYVCICRPWLKFLDIKVAKRIIFALLVVSLTLGLITSLAYGVYHQKHVIINQFELVNNGINLLENSSFSRLINESSIEFVQNLITQQNCSRYVTRSIGPTQYSKYNSCLQVQHNAAKMFGNESSKYENEYHFTGYCYPNEKILSRDFRKAYQTVYASLFLLVFLLVFALYALILRSILTRRSKRLRSSIAYRHYKGTGKNMVIYQDSKRQTKTMDYLKPLDNKELEQSATGQSELLECYSTKENGNVNGHVTSPDNKNSDKNHTLDTTKAVTVAGDVQGEEDKVIKSAAKMVVEADENKVTEDEAIVKYITNGRRRVPKKKRFSEDKHVKYHTTTTGDDCQQIEVFRVIPNNICRHDTRKSIRERLRLANIKTAGILFTVTLVFIIAFLPAWLMATRLLYPPNMIVFYMYFIYNVANPFIYAFFNQTFQKEMKTVLKCKNV